MTQLDFVNWLVNELTRVVGASLETTASATAGNAVSGDGFVATIAASGAGRGDVRVYVARAGAESLARAASGAAANVADARIVELLKELVGQTLAGFDGSSGIVLTVTAAAAAPELPSGGAVSVEISAQGLDRPIQVLVVGEIAESSDRSGLAQSRTLDVIMDIDLPLVVRFGRTELPLKTLTTLGPGSVIDLGRAPDEPVDVLISNRVVARGEVVIVAGNYGVRVHDVVSPAERARSLEAELA